LSFNAAETVMRYCCTSISAAAAQHCQVVE
jgi:hypothetical protein